MDTTAAGSRCGQVQTVQTGGRGGKREVRRRLMFGFRWVGCWWCMNGCVWNGFSGWDLYHYGCTHLSFVEGIHSLLSIKGQVVIDNDRGKICHEYWFDYPSL